MRCGNFESTGSFANYFAHVKRQDSQLIIASILVLAGFASAFGLAVISNHKNSYLVTSKPLVEGHVIAPGDLHIEKSALWNGANYLSDKYSIIGTVVKRFVGQDEFLTADMLAMTPSQNTYRAVPLSVMSSDLPANLMPGQLTDIYFVPPADENGKAKGSKIVLSKIRVLSIDRKGQNLGNAAILLFSVPVDSVIDLLNATRLGKVVVIATST